MRAAHAGNRIQNLWRYLKIQLFEFLSAFVELQHQPVELFLTRLTNHSLKSCVCENCHIAEIVEKNLSRNIPLNRLGLLVAKHAKLLVKTRLHCP